MNEKEVGELRRRLRPEKNSITHIRGCYVNEMGESVAQFDQSLALMTQEEIETLLALLRRTLSGTLGKNLLDLSFETRQVVEGGAPPAHAPAGHRPEGRGGGGGILPTGAPVPLPWRATT